jgi:hypothetical protein
VSPVSVSESDADTIAGRHVLLSAGIPDEGNPDDFNPLEIAAAATTASRRVLQAGGRLLFGGQPGIAPIVFQVAQAFARGNGRPPVTVYQSRLYADMMPPAIRQLQAQGLATLEVIDAVPGDRPERGRNLLSLDKMRAAMLSRENDPVAGIFIGGMDGIRSEFEKFRELYPERPTYIFGAPGGAARRLALEELHRDPAASALAGRLTTVRDYDAGMDDVLRDLARVLGT